jgi:uncharacterized membrane protein (UPF0127 family)
MGLMGRHSLAPGAGLWLPESNGIHMMFMRFPIDAVFLGRPGADGTRPVLAARADLPVWRGLVPFVRGAKGVLELPIGTIVATGTQARAPRSWGGQTCAGSSVSGAVLMSETDIDHGSAHPAEERPRVSPR